LRSLLDAGGKSPGNNKGAGREDPAPSPHER
jgi:hypothetical protein